MRRSRARNGRCRLATISTAYVLGVGCFLAGGCNRPGPTPVYVDLAQIPRTPKLQVSLPLPARPQVPLIGPQAAHIQAKPEERVYVPESRGRVEAAIQQLRENRATAYRELLDDLRRTYLSQVAAKEREGKNAILQDYRVQFEAAVASLSADFEAYAAQRELPTLRLALLVGVPDPDPLSQRDSEIVGDLIPNRAALARAIRTEIRLLDEQFAATVRRRLDPVRELRDEQITALLAELANLQAQLDARAEAEAQLATQGTPLTQAILATLSEKLPEVPAAVVVSASPPRPPARPVLPVVPSRPIGPNEIETEVDVWAKINGYKRVGRPSEGRDATREFQAWRMKLGAGG